MRDSTSSSSSTSSMPLMSDGKGKARLRFSDPTDCVKEASWDWEFYFVVWMRTGPSLRSSKAFWPSSCFVNNLPDWLTLSARRRWILNSIHPRSHLPARQRLQSCFHKSVRLTRCLWWAESWFRLQPISLSSPLVSSWHLQHNCTSIE